MVISDTSRQIDINYSQTLVRQTTRLAGVYRGTLGKTRGLTFLIWDVGGQEKIRPLWRSYTRQAGTRTHLVYKVGIKKHVLKGIATSQMCIFLSGNFPKVKSR